MRLTENTALVTYDLIRVQRVNGTQLETECVTWPVAGNATTGPAAVRRCEAGGDAKHDGGTYHYNTGRGTPHAVCGEDAKCWCCRKARDYEAKMGFTFAMNVILTHPTPRT